MFEVFLVFNKHIMEIITWSISIKKILEDNRFSFCKKYGNRIRSYSFRICSQSSQLLIMKSLIRYILMWRLLKS